MPFIIENINIPSELLKKQILINVKANTKLIESRVRKLCSHKIVKKFQLFTLCNLNCIQISKITWASV